MTNWKCQHCGFDINFARETHCSMCGEDNPNNPPSGPVPVMFWAWAAFVVCGVVVFAAMKLL